MASTSSAAIRETTVEPVETLASLSKRSLSLSKRHGFDKLSRRS